ncbi:enoyl-CoA hydratase-related protein [Nocardia sp. CDC159]|uniref:Enoyl-CoA hydratase-related protein n=1 Tax=Nocardia pulmonis TaxID=2951408 RepID=A0A9X2E812_9NOCA|nr:MULTISPECIES: enoyl-CoA hydratase/isomerase family protein [Nocardia]MCM6774570.1 enoyl-CoA hydratase-related protein [Nocardia pulmonis]MCM6787365.1 enoyl-CoA hydratase-related protein [Nocardia sp. CDC159]
MAGRGERPRFDIHRDGDGVVTVTMNDRRRFSNVVDESFIAEFASVVSELARSERDIAGVILTSAKSTFCLGADPRTVLCPEPEAQRLLAHRVGVLKAALRRLEALDRPVVAAVSGSALGGGFELALACHHRIAVDAPGVEIGLPEAAMGLLPGAGGVVRTVRLLGADAALREVLVPGTRFRPAAALAVGLVDELAPDRGALIAQARARIAAGRRGLRAGAPVPKRAVPHVDWDMRTPIATVITDIARASAQADPATAEEWETRGLVRVASGERAAAMVDFWYDRQYVAAGGTRPDGSKPGMAHSVSVTGPPPAVAEVVGWAERAGVEVTARSTDPGAELALTTTDREGSAHGPIRLMILTPDAAEILTGASTGDETVGAAFDFLLRARVLPIVVRGPDSVAVRLRLALLAELTAMVESGLSLTELTAAAAAAGFAWAAGTPGPAADANGAAERMIFAVVTATLRCLDTGLLRSPEDADIVSVEGAGFPAHTGGAHRFATRYPGGIAGFRSRAAELTG